MSRFYSILALKKNDKSSFYHSFECLRDKNAIRATKGLFGLNWLCLVIHQTTMHCRLVNKAFCALLVVCFLQNLSSVTGNSVSSNFFIFRIKQKIIYYIILKFLTYFNSVALNFNNSRRKMLHFLADLYFKKPYCSITTNKYFKPYYLNSLNSPKKINLFGCLNV